LLEKNEDKRGGPQKQKNKKEEKKSWENKL
jgi:hypothetical protein